MAEFKREAARQRRTISEMVEAALRLLLRSHRKASRSAMSTHWTAAAECWEGSDCPPPCTRRWKATVHRRHREARRTARVLLAETGISRRAFQGWAAAWLQSAEVDVMGRAVLGYVSFLAGSLIADPKRAQRMGFEPQRPCRADRIDSSFLPPHQFVAMTMERFAQNRALGRKVSDEFTVPLCRGHHRELLLAAAWVVCTVAISCWPKVLRTISNPLDSGA